MPYESKTPVFSDDLCLKDLQRQGRIILKADSRMPAKVVGQPRLVYPAGDK
jgi:hypothetical protein